VTYRSATADDIDAVVALWATCGLGSGVDVDRREIIERLREDDGFFIVGLADDGSLKSTVMGCYDNHRGWIKRMAVDPAHRRSGEGRGLVAELERRFVAAGITKLRLSVYEQNETAGEFWEALGFSELEEIRYFTKTIDP